MNAKYIVRDRCTLSDDEFVYLIKAQREYGIPEQWYRYNHPYLYIDGYKYWTMGGPISDTKVINRQKVFSEFDSLPHQELAHSPELMQEVTRLFNSAFAGREVYECGCSEGNTIRNFGIPPRLYRGVDPSQKAIDTIKASFPQYAGRIFHSSFEESVRYWSHSNAVILATFGTASYIMQPYLKILAESGLEYFLMFYREGFCPAEFRQMHHFEYTDKDLSVLFSKNSPYLIDGYRLISSIKE